MKKDVKSININYSYIAEHAGAHYTLNHVDFMNHGDFMEVAVKAAYGLEAKKDGNTSFDKASDIPEYSASVKSSNATVFNRKLGDDFESSLNVFFQQVASTEFWYVADVDEELNIYKMDADEFRSFLEKFAKYTERQVVRLPKTSGKMITWLENKLQSMGKVA